jgi:hypothetical protein
MHACQLPTADLHAVLLNRIQAGAHAGENKSCQLVFAYLGDFVSNSRFGYSLLLFAATAKCHVGFRSGDSLCLL